MLLLRKLEIDKASKALPASSPATNSSSSLKSQNSGIKGTISVQVRDFKPTKEQEDPIKNLAFNKVEVTEEKIGSGSSVSARDKIIEMLKQNDEGIDRDKIILSLNLPVEEINKAVEEMLENAEIYEPKPGRIRML